MTRIVLFLGLLVLTGCAHTEPMSCDGSDKRPINPGKWDQSLWLGTRAAHEVRP